MKSQRGADEQRQTRPIQRADARANRERILQAAQARFAADGLAAEMDAIARAAGVAVGTLYHHFGDKETLLEAVVSAGLQQVAEFAQGLLHEPDAGAAVEQLVRYFAHKQVEDQAYKELLAAAPKVRAKTLALKRELGPLLHQVLARAQSAGQVRADLVASDIPALLAGLPTGKEEELARQRYLTIILKGLR